MYRLLFILLLSMSIQQNEFDVQMERDLQTHVYVLSADSMEGRGVGTRGLEESAEYIQGYIDGLAEESSMHRATADTFVGPDGTKLLNIGTFIPGSADNSGRILLVAHYDHLGYTTPDSLGNVRVLNGAHDNASGVAVVLETGRLLASRPHSLRRAVEIQFFSGEEAGLLGSRHYVNSGKTVLDSIYAVVNVDAVGHLDDNPLISIGLAGQGALSAMVNECAESLMIDVVESPHSYETGDHAPFLAAGIPGFQITTGPHIYMNTPDDDANTLDYQGLRMITTLIHVVVESLATTGISLEIPKPPLTSPGNSAHPRVRFGIVPSFEYSGVGVQALNTIAGSPAEQAGIRDGDIISAIDDQRIEALGDLAATLRLYSPGDSAVVSYYRSGVLHHARVGFATRNE